MASGRERADILEQQRAWIDKHQPLVRLRLGRVAFVEETAFTPQT
jgi:hypothetical protein